MVAGLLPAHLDDSRIAPFRKLYGFISFPTLNNKQTNQRKQQIITHCHMQYHTVITAEQETQLCKECNQHSTGHIDTLCQGSSWECHHLFAVMVSCRVEAGSVSCGMRLDRRSCYGSQVFGVEIYGVGWALP